MRSCLELPLTSVALFAVLFFSSCVSCAWRLFASPGALHRCGAFHVVVTLSQRTFHLTFKTCLVGWLGEQLPIPPMRKNIAQGLPQQEDPRCRWG